MARFSEEQWLEISRARQRLLDYKNSIQMYPSYPEKAQPYPQYVVPGEEAPLPVVFPEHRLLNKLNELQGIAYNNRQKIQEHISYSQKKGARTYSNYD